MAQSFPPGKNSVLLVSEPLQAGGRSLYAQLLLEGLEQAGLSPRLVATDTGPKQLFRTGLRPRIQALPYLNTPVFWRLSYHALQTWVRGDPPALIHGLSARTLPLCNTLAKRLGCPFVVTVFEFHARKPTLSRRCFKLLAFSESVRVHLVNQLRIPSHLVSVAPMGMPLPRLEPAHQAAREASAMPTVTTCASLVPNQKLDVFLKGMALVRETTGLDAHYVIIGDGPQELALRRLARTLNLEQNLLIVHPAEPVDSILQATDVYVQTGEVDGFGLHALQAMAYGCPVVAASAGSLAALIREGTNGYLVPSGDHEDLASRVGKLLADKPARHAMGQAARGYIRQDFAPQTLIQKVLYNYAEALGLKLDKSATSSQQFVIQSRSASQATRVEDSPAL
jgi:glycosyltransferase involved in cell wall biosynthesis